MNEPLTMTIPADVVLDIESLQSLRSMFEPFFARAEEWRVKALACKVTSPDDKRGMKFARESRLALREIRIALERRRKEAKEDSLRRGKAIDGFANIFKAAVEPIEAYLLEQEEFADRLEKARIEALRSERLFALTKVGGSYAGDVAALSDDEFAAALQDAKDLVRIRDERAAAEAAARIEAIRIEREKVEAIAAENAKLKAEAEARAAALAIERRKAIEEAAKLKAEADAKIKAAAEVAAIEAAKQRAIRDTERAEAERVAAEHLRQQQILKEKADAAEKIVREAQAKAQAEAQAKAKAEAAPDKAKLIALAATIRAIPTPVLTSDRGKSMIPAIQEAIEQLANRAEAAASNL